jgi:hypothetical protein
LGCVTSILQTTLNKVFCQQLVTYQPQLEDKMAKTMEITEVVKNVKKTYFGLLRVGSAFGKKPQLAPRFLGDLNTWRFSFGHQSGWHGINEWSKPTSSEYFSGFVLIYFQDELVWQQQYQGYYPKEALSVVRAALRDVCQRRHWQGGRGATTHVLRGYRYENHTDSDENYPPASFHGHEMVLKNKTIQPEIIGRLWYRGGLLMDI